MKILFYLSLLGGLAIAIYFYLFNFDNMSETELVNSVLYWYVPLTFGLYGLAANRIKSRMEDPESGAIAHILSGKDVGITVFTVILVFLGGVGGIIMFLLPLIILKPKLAAFDLLVGLLGCVFWLIGLYAFFVLLWPSL